MERYHARRSDKEIKSFDEILSIIQSQAYFTLAICEKNQPYVVSMDYVFDLDQNCFYCHFAYEGKKINILKNNPIIWGQITKDNGYIQGECNHAYETVQFSGRCSFITDLEEKQQALMKLIIKFEKNPDVYKTKFITETSLKSVMIGKIDVTGISAKKSR